MRETICRTRRLALGFVVLTLCVAEGSGGILTVIYLPLRPREDRLRSPHRTPSSSTEEFDVMLIINHALPLRSYWVRLVSENMLIWRV